MGPAADDHVRTALRAAAQELRDLARKMLAVRIDADDAVETAREGPVETALHRAALAAPPGMAQHDGPGIRGNRRGGIDRTVIDHDDVRQLREAPADHGTDARFRIERRNDDRESLGHRQWIDPRVSLNGLNVSGLRSERWRLAGWPGPRPAAPVTADVGGV